MINVAGRWRERNVRYPGRSARNARRSNRGNKRKAALNAQKSAEAIVPQKKNEGRAEPIQPGVTGERRTAWRKQKTLGTAAARKEIARNAKGTRERGVLFNRKQDIKGKIKLPRTRLR